MRSRVALFLLYCLLAVPVAAQQATVTRNVNLRPSASTVEDPRRLLLPGEILTLLSPTKSGGYYHVVTQDNEEGWVWAKNVEVDASAPPADPPGPPLPPAGSEIVAHASCPATGTHKVNGQMVSYDAASDAGLRNEAKRHVPVGVTPRTLALADFQALQDSVSLRFADAHSSKTDFHPNRSGLHSIGLGTALVNEGELVQLQSFVIAVKGEGSESVNCGVADGKDIHLSLGAQGASEYQGIVAEMIPQLARPDGWDTTTLGKLRSQQLQVLVIGGLTYDNEHLVNDDPAHPKSGQPKRISLWEIHPITQFYVCSAAPCDPANHAQWTTLSSWAKAHP